MNIFTVLDISSILSTNTKTYQSLRISTGLPLFFQDENPAVHESSALVRTSEHVCSDWSIRPR